MWSAVAAGGGVRRAVRVDPDPLPPAAATEHAVRLRDAERSRRGLRQDAGEQRPLDRFEPGPSFRQPAPYRLKIAAAAAPQPDPAGPLARPESWGREAVDKAPTTTPSSSSPLT